MHIKFHQDKTSINLQPLFFPFINYGTVDQAIKIDKKFKKDKNRKISNDTSKQ